MLNILNKEKKEPLKTRAILHNTNGVVYIFWGNYSSIVCVISNKYKEINFLNNMEFSLYISRSN